MRIRRPSGTAAVQIGRALEPLDTHIVACERHSTVFEFACHFCYIADECMFGLGLDAGSHFRWADHRRQMAYLLFDVVFRSLHVAAGESPEGGYVPVGERFVATMDQEVAFEYESYFYGRPPKCRAVRIRPTKAEESKMLRDHHMVAHALSDMLVTSLARASSGSPHVALRVAGLMLCLIARYSRALAIPPPASRERDVIFAMHTPAWPKGGPTIAIEWMEKVSDENLIDFCRDFLKALEPDIPSELRALLRP